MNLVSQSLLAPVVGLWLLLNPFAGQAAAPADDSPVLQNERVGIRYHLASGTFDVIDTVTHQPVLEAGHTELSDWSSTETNRTRTARFSNVRGELGRGRRLTVESAAPGLPTLISEFTLYGQTNSFVVLRAGVVNSTAAPLRLKEFRPLADGQVFSGGRWLQPCTLTGNSGANETAIQHSPYASSANNLLLTLKQDGVRHSLVMGGLKTAEFTKWAHTLPEGGVSIRAASLARALPGACVVAYLDCGEPIPRSAAVLGRRDVRPEPSRGPSLALLEGASYRFPNPFPGQKDSSPFSSVVFHAKAVRFSATGLEPSKRYFLGFSWWDADANGRVGSICLVSPDSKSRTLAKDLRLPSGAGPQGLPREYALPIPKEAYAEGRCQILFNSEAPVPNIVVSEVWLWEARDDAVLPVEWAAGRTVSPVVPVAEALAPTMATLEAADPVGKLVEPGQKELAEDSFYLDLLTADPFAALEQYGRVLRQATGAKPNPYDFPTVCAWYAGVWHTKGAQNHPEKSTYKINTTAGLVEEAQKMRESGFLNYARAAGRLVPDNYTPQNPQGWWDDEHWRQHGLYTAPYETSAKFGTGMHRQGCLAFTYIQPTCGWSGSLLSQDFREGHTNWLCGKEVKRALDCSQPAVQVYLRRQFGALRGHLDGLMVDYCDDLWQTEASRGGFADPHITATAFYRQFFRCVKDGLGPNSWLHERNLGEPNNDLTLGITDSQRTSGDTDKISPELVSRSGLRWYKNRVVLNYDMDSKDLTGAWKASGWTGSDQDGRRMLLTMAYVTASRLLLANSFRDLDAATLHDLSRVFPYPAEAKSARPIDAFVGQGYPRVYDFAVDENWHQLALFNSSLGKSETISVPLAGEAVAGALNLAPEKEYYLFDFWNHRFVGKLKGTESLSELLRPGEARMLSVHTAEAHPQFIGSNRHLMQGYLDMPGRPVWDARRRVLSGAAKVVAGETYEAVLALNGYRPVRAAARKAGARIQAFPGNPALAVLHLDAADNRLIRWQVTFESCN